MKITNILVVEDIQIVRKNMKIVLSQICGIPDDNIEFARWYSEAEDMITSGKEYSVILLDHHMPRVDPGMDDRDDRYYDLCYKIGYGLLPFIRENRPQAIVIGTSSLEAEEIEGEVPEKKLVKSDMFDDLPKLIETIRNGG